MTTHFITAEIDLQASPEQMQQAIATELQKHGDPLRWAITQVTAGKAQVEAVVTQTAEVESQA